MIDVIDRPERIVRLADDLESKDTDSLKKELVGLLFQTAEQIRKAAAIIGILESRGEDLSQFKSGLVTYLRKVACGQVLPEIVIKFFGRDSLRYVAALPIPDQERCLRDDGIEIGVFVNGEIDTRVKPVVDLEKHEARQVFAADHIRNPNEQIAWIRAQELNRPQVTPHIEASPWTTAGKSIVINKPMRLSRRDLQTMLKSITG